MIDADFEPLTYQADPGTEVEVQSHDSADFHDAVADEDGKVRDADNGAIFNANRYFVVTES